MHYSLGMYFVFSILMVISLILLSGHIEKCVFPVHDRVFVGDWKQGLFPV